MPKTSKTDLEKGERFAKGFEHLTVQRVCKSLGKPMPYAYVSYIFFKSSMLPLKQF